jgi:UDP:flavonoid glycosyltransferase YjiC (YdhE family)
MFNHSEEMGMRVLFTSWPAWGHLYPMYPLARAAQDAGHQVTFASGEDVVAGLQKDGFHTWSVGPTKEQAVAARGAAQQASPQRPWDQRAVADISDMFAPASARRAEAMLPLVEAQAPDLVVHGAGDASGPAIAAMFGRPSVLHGLSLLPPGFERLLSPLMAAAEEQFGLPGLDRRVLEGPLLDLTPASMLPPGYEDSPHRQPLRPSAGELDPDPEMADLISALPFDRTVYLTLGTIVNNAPGVMETVLAGVLDCGTNVVVTTGPGFDSSRLGEPPAHVLIREHIGQATVLRSCSVVISHAGAGTMLGALSFGLPQLALPIGAEQPYNAAALEKIGAGLRLELSDVTAEAVHDAATRLLDEASFAAAARRIQNEITAMPTAREVLNLLEQRVLTMSR